MAVSRYSGGLPELDYGSIKVIPLVVESNRQLCIWPPLLQCPPIKLMLYFSDTAVWGRSQLCYYLVLYTGSTSSASKLVTFWVLPSVPLVSLPLAAIGTMCDQRTLNSFRHWLYQWYHWLYLPTDILPTQPACLPTLPTYLNSNSSQCALGKSSIARKPEVHPKVFKR